VRKVEPDYFTTAMTYTKVEVFEEGESAQLFEHALEQAAASAFLGEVSVVEKVVGYKKIKFHTHENVGYGEVRLPEMQMHTTAFWLIVPEHVVESLPYARPSVLDALRGFGNALHTVAAVGLMIDPRDLGHTLGDRTDPHSPPAKRKGAPGFDPTLFFYDHIPGGIGLAPRLFEARQELLTRARHVALGCSCSAGCPACIGPEIGQNLVLGGASPTLALPHGHVSRKVVLAALLDALGIVSSH
jgi:DEAD/DEAH box helicase domain-containing protein